MIRLRVADVAAGLRHARSTSAPNASSRLTFRIGERRLRACGQHVSLLLERAHGEQPLIPALLEIRSNKAVLWVDHVVLPTRTSRFVARLLEGELNLPPLLGIFGALRLQGTDSSLDAEWLKSLDHFDADSAIDTHASKRDAPITAVIEMAPAAVIAPRVAVRATVGDM